MTSSRSDSPIDDEDEDRSTLNNDDTQDLSSSPNRTENLPPPDLVASIKAKNFNDEYCQHLQHMAQLSNEQSSSQTEIPFFGKDDHAMNTQCNPLPTSTLEKNVLFN